MTVRFLLLGQLVRLQEAGYDVTAISAPGPWVTEIEAEGVRFLPWTEATRAWDPGADVRAFAELVRIFRRERFDLVHTHNPKPGVLGRIAARVAGVPHVVNTVHGLYAMPEDSLSKRLPVLTAEAVASRFSDVELFQSEEDLRWARRRHVVRERRSVLLGNGTDLSTFDPELIGVDERMGVRRSLGIPPDVPVVGTVGRIVEEKGYRELFEAFRSIRASFPDARLLVVGGTDHDKADAIETDDLPGPDQGVVLAGWRTDIPQMLSAMDLFVLASWREGMPRSAIEAAAMGLPLVVTDIRGCREVVRDGIEGLVVPPRNAPALASAIERLLKDEELRKACANAALLRARSRFDERRVADTVVRVTDHLVSRRSSAAASARFPS
jgi:glycosyltransferase involved in cell wall biosynthesis